MTPLTLLMQTVLHYDTTDTTDTTDAASDTTDTTDAASASLMQAVIQSME